MTVTVTVTNVPDADTIVRFVKSSHLRRDENGNVIGVNATAFRLRPGEQYLSASHLESVPVEGATSGLAALKAFFLAKFGGAKNAAFTEGNVTAIKQLCASKSKIRVTNEPKDWNPAYAAVRRYPDSIEICERLAAELWARHTRFADLP